MGMKERIKSVIDQYGFTIEVGVPSMDTNEYGEDVNPTINYIQEKAIATDTEYSYTLSQLGITEDIGSGLILPYDTSVVNESYIKFDGKEFKVSQISPVKFGEDVVVYILKLE